MVATPPSLKSTPLHKRRRGLGTVLCTSVAHCRNLNIYPSNQTIGVTCINHKILIIAHLLHVSGSNTMNEEQLLFVKKFTMGHDVFVNLPTGYEKSLCYQCLLFVLNTRVHNVPLFNIVDHHFFALLL